MALIEVKNLTKTYGQHEAVKGLSFQLHEGRCVALLGQNGAGKTTTLKMLSGLISSTSGSISFQGLPSKQDWRQYIGYLPQYPTFYGWMSAKEFLVYVARLAHLHKQVAQQRAEELLELVGLSSDKNRRIGKFSGGMKQRLGIAQAMIHQPKLLMLDEPVSALDPVGRREVLEMLKKLKEETTILFSTHVLNDAEEVSDDVLMIHQGELALSGSLQELKGSYQQSKITLEIADMDEQMLQEKLIEWQSWEEIDQASNSYQIQIIAHDVAAAKERLLRDIVDSRLSLQKFEVGKMSLEDLFMQVVK